MDADLLTQLLKLANNFITFPKTRGKNAQQYANKVSEEISKTDKEIDKNVLQLYGLTDEEIEIVEQS